MKKKLYHAPQEYVEYEIPTSELVTGIDEINRELWRQDYHDRSYETWLSDYEWSIQQAECHDPFEVMERELLSDRMNVAMAGLSERHRQVVEMSVLQNMSSSEIGKALGISKWSAYDCLQVALKKLKKNFER